ncbi:hypothetical protein A7M93_20495 [Acinetobacter baumannii]|nr:hypothetical protein A7M93_20495 [Acinetobacter baumannii]
MPPKKTSAPGAGTLQPLDPNQDVLSLREARSQKRKATSPTPPEDDLDQEIQSHGDASSTGAEEEGKDGQAS